VTASNGGRSSFEERAARLEKIRQQAEMEARAKGVGSALGSRQKEVTEKSFPKPHSSIASARTGYYGTPLLKVPAWTWEVPLYFFVGGAAGSAAALAQIGKFTSSDYKLVNDARWIAAIGGAISPVLLISDLGRPERFLNMLRVFKTKFKAPCPSAPGPSSSSPPAPAWESPATYFVSRRLDSPRCDGLSMPRIYSP
jgi:hypothetical protein